MYSQELIWSYDYKALLIRNHLRFFLKLFSFTVILYWWRNHVQQFVAGIHCFLFKQ